MLATYLANIKSSGIYRFTFDKSELPGGTLQTARLVVGYSEKGPFNTVVYIKNAAQFKETYGNISKKLERYGDFFHRTALQCLTKEPIYCLNLKPFTDEKVKALTFVPGKNSTATSPIDIDATAIFDRSRFWTLEPENFNTLDKTKSNYITLCSTDTSKCSNTVFLRPSNKTLGGKLTLKEWYDTYNSGEYPDYLASVLDKLVDDYLVDVYVFRGKFTDTIKKQFADYFEGDNLKSEVTLSTGVVKDTLDLLAANDNSGFIAKYTGSVIPYFKNTDGSYYSIDLKFNDDNSVHQMMMHLNEDYLSDSTVANINLRGVPSKLSFDATTGLLTLTADALLPGNTFVTPYYDKYVVSADADWGYTKTNGWGNPVVTVFSFAEKWSQKNNVVSIAGTHNYISKGDWFFDSSYNLVKVESVTATDTGYDIKFSGSLGTATTYLIRFNCHSLAGVVKNSGVYVDGYTYSSLNPSTANNKSWLKSCLNTIIDNGGLYEALTNGTDVDYRYIVDTFEGTVNCTDRWAILSGLAKDKGNAFVISNFPSVKAFGGKNVKAIVDSSTLPSDDEGASFIAFYTPVKVTDNGIKTIIPVAGLVSNLFMNKYTSRQPYYIVAGPNYGVITTTGLVGPEYNFTRDDLDLLEPFGVNALIYKPTRGTFINSNQTAKQTPVTALSKINVRELVIYLQDTIADMLQGYQWELNTSTLRDNIKAKADAICEKVLSNGGLYDYENVCDSSNNTDEVIDNEMVVLSTSIEPANGAGKMVHELTIYSTGQMRSSISE